MLFVAQRGRGGEKEAAGHDRADEREAEEEERMFCEVTPVERTDCALCCRGRRPEGIGCEGWHVVLSWGWRNWIAGGSNRSGVLRVAVGFGRLQGNDRTLNFGV